MAVPRWGRGDRSPKSWLGPSNLAGPQILAKPLKFFSRTFDTLWSIDSQKKISKFDATGCQF